MWRFKQKQQLRLLWQKFLPWAIFLALMSVFHILFIDNWIARWTNVGPTYFLSKAVNPIEQRQLPPILQPIAEDSLWWLFLHFPTDQQGYFKLLLPLLIVAVLCLSLRSIPSSNKSRLFIKGLLLLLGVRYFYWRTFATINNQTYWLSTIFSSVVWAVELAAFASFILYTLQTILTNTKQRRNEANQFSSPVECGDYLPSVDIFIPTHNELPYIVRRTVVGCQALDYPNKKIYILDDGKYESSQLPEGAFPTGRPEIRALAKEMSCEYIEHPNNKKRKAGNLNNAFWQTSGELIAVMDADFVPFTNFLTRTVGFFRGNEHVYMVQTPQDFYNPDCHIRNLGLDYFLPNDMEHFYGLLQPNRDVFNSVICCGSSYVIRRESLREIGGYYEDCCVEDFQTSLKLLTQNRGRAIYLNEKLSWGESPRSFSTFINQRLRWLQGNVQVYFRGKDLPIWTQLNIIQKSFMISLALYCINPVIRVVFLITPLLSIYSGIAPVLAPLREVCYYFLPFWLLLVVVYGWASEYRVNYFWNECYEVIFCFPALERLLSMAARGMALQEGDEGVTRKGIDDKASKANNWKSIAPLVFLLVCTGAVMLLRYVGLYNGWWPRLNDQTVPLLFWLGYNFVLMLIAVLSAIDQQENRKRDRFPLQTPCIITPTVATSSTQVAQSYTGTTKNVSEGGGLLIIGNDCDFQEDTLLRLELPKEGFSANARIRRRIANSGRLDLGIQFSDLSVDAYRHLIKILYCTGERWWHGRKQPGLTDSILALLSPLVGFRLPPIRSRSKQ